MEEEEGDVGGYVAVYAGYEYDFGRVGGVVGGVDWVGELGGGCHCWWSGGK